ncbi:MAG: 1-acyl-sn-glycerol-3-phosphate acyltransferase [Rickettsiales bacterium]|jgi:1-acyl-sn-glycerol-3-phosphate acyltransferase|nr:1-acyl-sn-glycerol-3-phosphate acyltransferase [Rickettsiales bacterium]
MKIIFNFILFTWFILWMPLLAVGLVSRRWTRVFIIADAHGVLAICRIVAGIRYKIHGRAMDKCIIAAKHMSILEVAMLVTSVPDNFFIIKRELLWLPVYGWCFARIGFVGINRVSGATNMNKLAAAVASRIASGRRLVIFPEGTRKLPGAGVSLKRGLLFLADKLNLPIQTVGTDSGVYWPRQGKMRSGTANLYYSDKTLPANSELSAIASAIAAQSA